MPKHESQAQREDERRGGQTWRERKQRILTHGEPSITESIADAVVAKNGDLFFLAQPDGRIPQGDGHGLGLYYHDCRFLKSYELKLAGAMPMRYPVANHPLAMASGATPFMVTTALGLEPDAFEGKLRIARPMLSEFADRIEIRRLKVGDTGADFRFERTAKGGVAVEVLRADGRLEVEVDKGKAP